MEMDEDKRTYDSKRASLVEARTRHSHDPRRRCCCAIALSDILSLLHLLRSNKVVAFKKDLHIRLCTLRSPLNGPSQLESALAPDRALFIKVVHKQVRNGSVRMGSLRGERGGSLAPRAERLELHRVRTARKGPPSLGRPGAPLAPVATNPDARQHSASARAKFASELSFGADALTLSLARIASIG